MPPILMVIAGLAAAAADADAARASETGRASDAAKTTYADPGGTFETAAEADPARASDSKDAAHSTEDPRPIRSGYTRARPTFIGPTLDPIGGSTVLGIDREWLPQTRQLANLADFWFLEVVNMQNSGGGIATFDPQYTSAHGRSYTLTGHYWNGLDVSDPARPGEPLIDLPYFAWDSIRYESLNTVRPGYHVRLEPERDDTFFGRASFGANVGGPLLFIPDGFMDREPSFPPGASTEVRELDQAVELEAQTSIRTEFGALRLLAERLDHQRNYPTLVDPETGAQIDDESSRNTFMGIGRVDYGPLPFEFLLSYQSKSRSHEDGQFRLPEIYTHESDTDAWLGQLTTEADLNARWKLKGGLGLGRKVEDRVRHSSDPIVSDIEEQWFWLARPRRGEDLRRTRWNGFVQAERKDDVWPIEASLRVTQGTVRSDLEPVEFTGTTYRRGVEDSNDPNGVSIDVFDDPQQSREWIRNARLQVDGQWRAPRGWTLNYSLGLDRSAVGTPTNRTLSFLTPGIGVSAVWEGADTSRWFFILRREPDPLTFQHAQFLSATRPAGTRHRWEDDGDGIPESDEIGELQARFGGDTHRVSDDLDRPTSNHFAFGWESAQFGAFKTVLTGIARFQWDAMVARLAGPAADSYTRRLEDDPGGDGRGAERTDGGADQTPIFDRTPGTNGQELYELQNRDNPNLYIGAELQLASVETTWWFLNLQAKGYWNIGSATYGAFPDRNDPGILDENSADPNQRINQRGRFDQDRSFGINLMTGLEPFENFRSSVSLRYRDGQPFTRIFVLPAADGVDPTMVADPNVPVPQMAVWRGGPRHTFHMSLDGRLRYDLPLSFGEVSFIADGFNILGSATELNEDPRDGGSFRRALEAVPGRAFLLSVELSI